MPIQHPLQLVRKKYFGYKICVSLFSVTNFKTFSAVINIQVTLQMRVEKQIHRSDLNGTLRGLQLFVGLQKHHISLKSSSNVPDLLHAYRRTDGRTDGQWDFRRRSTEMRKKLNLLSPASW